MAAAQKTRRAPTLRTNILLLLLCGFFAVAIPAYWGFTTIVNSTVSQLGRLFGEKQILFDRSRGMGVLMQEIALAENLTRSPIIADWALDETNPDKQARAIAELEQYRLAFADHSYFFVNNASGRYYYNDAQNSHAGNPYSFTVRRGNPSDDWYFATIGLDAGCHLNVDHDDELDVTKVWINCVVKDGAMVLGVLGTGIDLTSFIRDVVDFPQTGVQSIFIDRSGAIQAHRDTRYIDFHSLTNAIEAKKTIFSLIDKPADRDTLKQMLTEVTTSTIEARSEFMQVDGRQMLVGVGYLDKLGWYNVAFIDVDAVIDRTLFLPIGLLLAATMIVVALVIAFIVKVSIGDRLARVEREVVAVNDDVTAHVAPDPGNDEIGRLSRSFATMASTVQDNMQTLERLVEERTSELQSLAYRDQLTGIANRRGFADGFDRIKSKASEGARLALLLIDIDHFKAINDRWGHQAGDEVAAELARRISVVLRPNDVCGRWGGDEFIVLFSDLGMRPLKVIGDAMHRGLSNPVILRSGTPVPVTVSIGACLVEPDETVEQVADMADAALYMAKENGRNRVAVYDPTSARSHAGLR
jgi:diguanylate cyclase (GGDEF)-like protein